MTPINKVIIAGRLVADPELLNKEVAQNGG